jgi:hypothetical protein
MLNHRIFSGMILLSFLGMSSCTEVIKESQKVLKETQKPIVEGKFFPLETEGIKMYLPKEFIKLSKSEYLEFVEKSTDTLAVNLEKERLRDLARSQSKVYFFQHTSSNSILTVFPTEYIKFTKSDAQMLLNDIKYHHDVISEQSGILFTKKEARFFETAEAQIFKSIYSISSEDLIGDFYKQIYFVSFNNKSFALTLETPFLVDFDPYLEKIRVL